MKQFATWFTHGVPGGTKLRAAIYHARTGADVLAEVERFFVARIEAGGESPSRSRARRAKHFPMRRWCATSLPDRFDFCFVLRQPCYYRSRSRDLGHPLACA